MAGEMSGHIFFADRYFGFDDAIYASARLAEILSRSGETLSAMLADLPKTFSTPEIRIYASDEVKFRIVDEVLSREINPEVVATINALGGAAGAQPGRAQVEIQNGIPFFHRQGA